MVLTDSTYPRAEANVPKVVAVIDIGATSIRMQIAQVDKEGRVEKLESLSQAVGIGRDSFIKGSIERKTIEECVGLLNGYRRKLEEYGVGEENIRVVATSGVSEAANRLAFQDRIYVATGFEVQSLDLAELHRATYLGILPAFEKQPELFAGRTAICEVGGGTTELILLNQRDVEYSNSFRLGSLRLKKMLDSYDAPLETSRALVESRIAKSLAPLEGQVDSVDFVIGMGSEVRFVAAAVGQAPVDDQLVEIRLAQLEEFVEKLFSMDANQIANEFHFSLAEAQTFGPALVTQMEMARRLGVDRIMVSDVNLRDSLVKEMVSGGSWASSLHEQIVRSALSLGRKYDFDEPHSSHVAKLALKLFDDLADRHQLGPRMRYILEIASLLHEIGRFIHNSGFHKHSMYLISNSEFFGVNTLDHKLIALVARYHRRALPNSSHERFRSLRRNERVFVSQLAALLRIANAMDESHQQLVRDFQCVISGDRIDLFANSTTDISMEQHAVKQAKALFENIYGMKVALLNGGA